MVCLSVGSISADHSRLFLLLCVSVSGEPARGKLTSMPDGPLGAHGAGLPTVQLL